MDILNATINLLSSGWFITIIIAGAMFAAGIIIDEKLVQEQEIGTLVIISALFGFLVMATLAGFAWHTGSSLALSQNQLLMSLLIGALEIVWVIPYLYALERRGAVVAGPMLQLIPVVGGLMEATFFGIISPSYQVSLRAGIDPRAGKSYFTIRPSGQVSG